jgi:hypothetical protein
MQQTRYLVSGFSNSTFAIAAWASSKTVDRRLLRANKNTSRHPSADERCAPSRRQPFAQRGGAIRPRRASHQIKQLANRPRLRRHGANKGDYDPGDTHMRKPVSSAPVCSDLRGKWARIAIMVAAVCVGDGAFAADANRPRPAKAVQRYANTLRASPHATHWKRHGAGPLAAARDPYADPAAPYKADRLSSPPGQPILNVPGQTTVLTRQVLDDKNFATPGDALRTVPGVTIGR